MDGILSVNARSNTNVKSEEELLRTYRLKAMLPYVAVLREKVVGHFVYRAFKDHNDVLMIEVDPDYRGQRY